MAKTGAIAKLTAMAKERSSAKSSKKYANGGGVSRAAQIDGNDFVLAAQKHGLGQDTATLNKMVALVNRGATVDQAARAVAQGGKERNLQAGGIAKLAQSGAMDKLAKLLRGTQETLPAAEREANKAKFLAESKTPMRLYHGTTATEGKKGQEAIKRIKPSKEGSLGSGVYLTPRPAQASNYTGVPNEEGLAIMAANKYHQGLAEKLSDDISKGVMHEGQEGGNMLPVYAQIKNPLVIEGKGDPMIEALVKLGIDQDAAARMVERAYENKGYIGKEVESRARAAGYDGLMQYRDGDLSEVVSYNPNAVKSAIGNKGTYNTNKPDLNEAAGGAVHMQAGGVAKLAKALKGAQKADDAAKTSLGEVGSMVTKMGEEGRSPIVPVPNRWFLYPDKFPHQQKMVERVLATTGKKREDFPSGAFIDPRTGEVLDSRIMNELGVVIDPKTNRPMMSAKGESGIERIDPKLGAFTKSNLVRKGLFKPEGGDPLLNDLNFLATIEKGDVGHKYGLATEYASPAELWNTGTGANPTLRPRSRGDLFGVGDVVGQVRVGRSEPHDVYEKLFVAPKGSDVPGVKLSKAKGGDVHMQAGGIARLLNAGKGSKKTPPAAETKIIQAPTVIVPSKLSNVKEAVRQSKGDYGARRVERAADEIPNLERMYKEEGLRSAFTGDNAQALMTMNPADFEKFALPLVKSKGARSPMSSSGEVDKYTLPTDEYVQYLQGLRGGFSDVPFLGINKEEYGLPLKPFISGHEGRHRSRALAASGQPTSLVRLVPRAELREPFPRRTQEEYIQALRDELDLTSNLVMPEGGVGSAVVLPDIYAKGGEVHMKKGGDPVDPRFRTAGGDHLDEFAPPRYRSAGRRPESQQDREASANIPVAVARGLVSGALGMPGDIESLVRIPYDYLRSPTMSELVTGDKTSKTILPTSEDIEKRLPFRGASQTPVGEMFTGAGQLAGGFYTGPGSGARAVMAVPKAVKRAGQDFAMAAGQSGPKIFIGPKAKTWDQAKADAAARMEQEGRDPVDIWRQTGTFRGADGIMRQEISDVGAIYRNPTDLKELGKQKRQEALDLGMRMITPIGQKDFWPKALTEAKKPVREEIKRLKSEADELGRFSDVRGQSAKFVLEHPELYKAYPELANIPVYQGSRGFGGASAGLMGGKGDMEVNIYQQGLRGNPRSSMLHEMQHAVQTLEDMAPGGSPSMAFQDPAAFKILEDLRAKASTPMSFEDYAERYSHLANKEAGYQDYLKSIPGIVKGMDRELQNQAAMEYYKRLAGEAEARATQTREGMTASQRAQEFPYGSYDVLPEDLIVRNPTGSVASLQTVYHGSPHKFDRFDASKIGTGEGAQAYGHGLYFAEAPGVAEGYAKTLANRDMANQGRLNAHANAQRLASLAGDPKYAADDIRFVLSNEPDHPQKTLLQDTLAFLDSGDFAKPLETKGNLYKVDLPDEKIARMLDWDKPLSEQPEVIKALKGTDYEVGMSQREAEKVADMRLRQEADEWAEMTGGDPVDYINNADWEKYVDRVRRESGSIDSSITGADLHRMVMRDEGYRPQLFDTENYQVGTSEALRGYGIPGIRYLDAGSRGATGTGKWKITMKNGEQKIYDFKPNDDVLEQMGATAEPAGTSNFVVFPGEEDALTILERKKEGGEVKMQAGGAAKTLRNLLKPRRTEEPSLPLDLPRAPAKTREEIRPAAQRMAEQMTGEFVRPNPKKSINPAKKSRVQFEMERGLTHDIRPTPGGILLPQQVADIEKQKGMLKIGVSGDTTIADKSLYRAGPYQLDMPSPQHGGPLYALGGEGAWASNNPVAATFQKRVQELSQAHGEAPVLGQFLAMGPQGSNFALHFADANLRAIDPSKMSKQQVEMFNNLIREGSEKSGPRPSFPGIEDKDSAYLHFAFDAELRKHFNAMMQKPDYTSKLGLPDGRVILHAITEPELRNTEVLTSGLSQMRLDPSVNPADLALSVHPTYSHVIPKVPGSDISRTKYPMAAEIEFPDVAQFVRQNYKPKEFTRVYQTATPRQIVDQQHIDEIKMYEELMKQYTGKKKGGKVGPLSAVKKV